MRPHAGIIPIGHAPVARPHREPIEVSIIVPFHDDASVLPHCRERLQRIGERLAVPRELLFVDDESPEGGQQAAMTAGHPLAPGDAVVILDADLQDPPEPTSRMLRRGARAPTWC